MRWTEQCSSPARPPQALVQPGPAWHRRKVARHAAPLPVHLPTAACPARRRPADHREKVLLEEDARRRQGGAAAALAAAAPGALAGAGAAGGPVGEGGGAELSRTSSPRTAGLFAAMEFNIDTATAHKPHRGQSAPNALSSRKEQ